MALVDPQTGDFDLLALVLLCLGAHNILNDLGKVTHVELIEELLSSWGELGVLAHIEEHLLGGIDDLGCQFLDLLIELREMSS